MAVILCSGGKPIQDGDWVKYKGNKPPNCSAMLQHPVLDMANDPLESFFRHLADRCFCENDLSDITWALCKVYPEVKILLAQFLGAPASIRVVELEREFDLGDGCRVDFICWLDEVPLFIESKLNDQNYHLRQYKEQAHHLYPKFSLALLSKHSLLPADSDEARRLGWTVHRWADFIEHLASQGFARESLIQAYIKYARQVCEMVDIRPLRIDPESLYSLISFYELAKELIDSASHDDFAYIRYKSARSESGPGWTGVYYSITHKPSGIEIWPWFGLGLDGVDDLEAHVFFTLDTNWNRTFLATHLGDLKRAATKFRIKETDDHLSLHASKGFLERLVERDVKSQRRMLGEMFAAGNTLFESEIVSAPSSLSMQR